MKKISRIIIKDLFGFLNHDVVLKDEGITFIHGPNGCGKTTFLSLITAFFNWDLTILNETKYSLLTIKFTDKTEICIQRNTSTIEDGRISVELPSLTFESFRNGTSENVFKYNNEIDPGRIPPRIIDDFIPFLRRKGTREWTDIRDDKILSYFEVVNRYHYMLPLGLGNQDRPEWLQSIQEETNLLFVQTQRLLKVKRSKRARYEEEKIKNVIEIYSEQIKDKISKKLAESATISQSKDRSFPQRLLSLSLDDSRSEEQIREDYKVTESKIEKLMSSGLIETEQNLSLPEQAFEDTEVRVLSLYLQDINEKLSVFDDLLQCFETFLAVVSPKLQNKQFKLSASDGFLIEATKGENQTLKPSQLSSGEQHQIVLFYELIFQTDDNSFVLIDEPEISLHVDWQRQFLSDISKIANLGKHSFLIATHSPQIIGARRDLAVSLDGGILND